jgi:hypothetical protein
MHGVRAFFTPDQFYAQVAEGEELAPRAFARILATDRAESLRIDPERLEVLGFWLTPTFNCAGCSSSAAENFNNSVQGRKERFAGRAHFPVPHGRPNRIAGPLS